MLLRKPKEFERVAQEWAVVYAGAPRNNTAGGSGGATEETLRTQEQQTEDQEMEDLAKYAITFLSVLWLFTHDVAGTMDITKT